MVKFNHSGTVFLIGVSDAITQNNDPERWPKVDKMGVVGSKNTEWIIWHEVKRQQVKAFQYNPQINWLEDLDLVQVCSSKLFPRSEERRFWRTQTGLSTTLQPIITELPCNFAKQIGNIKTITSSLGTKDKSAQLAEFAQPCVIP